MLTTGCIAHQDLWLCLMTVLKIQAFSHRHRLVPSHEMYLGTEVQERLKLHKRAFGGGRKARLKFRDAKQMLVYFGCYVTFDLSGILFDAGLIASELIAQTRIHGTVPFSVFIVTSNSHCG